MHIIVNVIEPVQYTVWNKRRRAYVIETRQEVRRAVKFADMAAALIWVALETDNNRAAVFEFAYTDNGTLF